jgi:hypothetical protein
VNFRKTRPPSAEGSAEGGAGSGDGAEGSRTADDGASFDDEVGSDDDGNARYGSENDEAGYWPGDSQDDAPEISPRNDPAKSVRRRLSSKPRADGSFGAGGPGTANEPSVPAAPTRTKTERELKSELRAKRLANVRNARKASSAMRPPEAQRGIYLTVVLVAAGLVSFFSTDVTQSTKEVHGKYPMVTVPPHNGEAVLLVALALIAGATIRWHRRFLTGTTFMLSAAIALGVPMPNNYADLRWVMFLCAAGYVLWMLIFRMNKDQKLWLAEHAPPTGGAGRTAPAGRGGTQRPRGTAVSRSRPERGRPAAKAASAPPPITSGRYTPPRAKPKAGPRKP